LHALVYRILTVDYERACTHSVLSALGPEFN